MIVRELNKEVWEEWVASRPPVIQEMCRGWPPDRLYLLKTTDQRVLIHSYFEDGTVMVDVLGAYNPGVFLDRRVFGINPLDLVDADDA